MEERIDEALKQRIIKMDNTMWKKVGIIAKQDGLLNNKGEGNHSAVIKMYVAQGIRRREQEYGKIKLNDGEGV